MGKATTAVLWVLFVLVALAFGLNGACMIATAFGPQTGYEGLVYVPGGCQMIVFGAMGLLLLRSLLRRPPRDEP